VSPAERQALVDAAIADQSLKIKRKKTRRRQAEANRHLDGKPKPWGA
jgi:hypothetical protein